jgi:hypothetical protein
MFPPEIFWVILGHCDFREGVRVRSLWDTSQTMRKIVQDYGTLRQDYEWFIGHCLTEFMKWIPHEYRSVALSTLYPGVIRLLLPDVHRRMHDAHEIRSLLIAICEKCPETLPGTIRWLRGRKWICRETLYLCDRFAESLGMRPTLHVSPSRHGGGQGAIQQLCATKPGGSLASHVKHREGGPQRWSMDGP